MYLPAFQHWIHTATYNITYKLVLWCKFVCVRNGRYYTRTKRNLLTFYCLSTFLFPIHKWHDFTQRRSEVIIKKKITMLCRAARIEVIFSDLRSTHQYYRRIRIDGTESIPPYISNFSYKIYDISSRSRKHTRHVVM